MAGQKTLLLVTFMQVFSPLSPLAQEPTTGFTRKAVVVLQVVLMEFSAQLRILLQELCMVSTALLPIAPQEALMAGISLPQVSGSGDHEGVAGWGYSTTASYAMGVHGYAQNTSTGNAYGGYFTVPNYGTGYRIGIYAEAPGGATGWAGWIQGDLMVTNELVVSGPKSALVKVDNGEYRLVYCQESPENWFEDFGEGQLINGKTHIELDPLFLQTVTINSQHQMKVFIQLNDENCKGTAVKRGTTGFDVVELQNGTSNASFSYRIVAKRKGYEDRRLAKLEGPTPEEMVAQSAKINADIEKNRVKTEQENQAVADQK